MRTMLAQRPLFLPPPATSPWWPHASAVVESPEQRRWPPTNHHRQDGQSEGELGQTRSLPVDAVRLHLAMLNDHTRTLGYIDAIRRTVREGDVVVDIGTGTGVLATAAAQAGARRVYALEVGPIHDVAQRVFEVNGVAERIFVIPRLSFRAQLPERADVIVSELIGDEPLSEGVVGITWDAARRFLKFGGRLIPDVVSLYALVLEMPERDLAQHCFRPGTLEGWKDAYGIDFSPLGSAYEPPLFRHYARPHEIRSWRPLSSPIWLADVRLGIARQAPICTSHTVTAERSGSLNAIAVYFELGARSALFLSTHPDRAGDDGHWASPVQLLNRPLAVRAGDQIELSYWYRYRTMQSGCAVVPR
jgi:Ribosomal protein L11 methyltransferase (PrmA)